MLLAVTLSGCASKPRPLPGPDAELLWAFRAEHSRWPRDISEVQEFSDKQSLGFDGSRYRTFEITPDERSVTVDYRTVDGQSGIVATSVSHCR